MILNLKGRTCTAILSVRTSAAPLGVAVLRTERNPLRQKHLRILLSKSNDLYLEYVTVNEADLQKLRGMAKRIGCNIESALSLTIQEAIKAGLYRKILPEQRKNRGLSPKQLFSKLR